MWYGQESVSCDGMWNCNVCDGGVMVVCDGGVMVVCDGCVMVVCLLRRPR